MSAPSPARTLPTGCSRPYELCCAGHSLFFHVSQHSKPPRLVVTPSSSADPLQSFPVFVLVSVSFLEQRAYYANIANIRPQRASVEAVRQVLRMITYSRFSTRNRRRTRKPAVTVQGRNPMLLIGTGVSPWQEAKCYTVLTNVHGGMRRTRALDDHPATPKTQRDHLAHYETSKRPWLRAGLGMSTPTVLGVSSLSVRCQ